jgi:hypothetical protein
MCEGWGHRQSPLPENVPNKNEKRIHFGIGAQISTIDNNKAVMVMKICWENEHKNQTVLGCFSFIFELSCPRYFFSSTVSPS